MLVQTIRVAVVTEVKRVIGDLFRASALLAGNAVDLVVVAFIMCQLSPEQGLGFHRDMKIQWLSELEDLLSKASNDDERGSGIPVRWLGSPVR